MDNKEIIEKALKGESIDSFTANFSEDQKKQLNSEIIKAAEDLKRKTLEELKGLREEKNRVITTTEDAKKSKEIEILNSFKKDQQEKAKAKFIADFKIPPEKVSEYDEFLKDSVIVDADKIYESLTKQYAFKNSDILLKNSKDFEEAKKNAKFFEADLANGGGGSVGSPEDAKYSDAAKQLYKEWQKSGVKHTLEDAQRVVDNGLTRYL